MDSEFWRRVEDLYHQAADLEEGARAEFLLRSCGQDALLLREVESLLAQEKKAEKFIEAPALHIVGKLIASQSPPRKETDDQQGDGRFPNHSAIKNPGPRIGRTIGSYELVERIGVGGMGEVYRAIRIDRQYQKQVAIKLVRSGEDSKFVIDRFRNERQVLASLDHPNIARLLDGGTTNEGVPYFVMELIEGQPIDQYCDNHKLSTTTRLVLFLQVCSALEYAHQHLIVHRDLKPSNILVTSDGIPKLLDFGIAKILDPVASDVSEPTISLFRLLTPSYASPEQIKGAAITTASDVYSLGVVLYELLTGHRPYHVGGRESHEIAQAVCEFEPQRPSVVIWRTETREKSGNLSEITPTSVSVVRDGTPDKLRKRLRGDLDNIGLMALRKEPERRYPSVDQFATDLRRHLENLPVNASRDTLQYRVSKLIRRHKAWVAATAIVVITLLLGMTITIREARIAAIERKRAEQRLSEVRGLANTLLFDVHDAVKDLPGTTPARKVLVEKSLKYLDGVMSDAGSDPSLRRDVAAAYEKMGDVQGNPDVANLGDTAGALQSYRKALAIRDSLAASSTKESDVLPIVADEWKIGLCLMKMGDFPEALNNFRESVRMNENLTKAATTPTAQDSLAGAYFYLARGLTQVHDFPHALENYQKAAAIRENQHGDTPAVDSRIRMRLAGTYGYMAGIYSQQGDLQQAIALEVRARDIMAQLLQGDPKNATYQEFTSAAYYWVAEYQRKAGKAASAEETFAKALSGFEKLATADPAEVWLQQHLGYCHHGIGMTQTAQGKTAAGLDSLERALTIMQRLQAADKTSFDKLSDVAETQADIAAAYETTAESAKASQSTAQTSWLQARTWYERSLDSWKQLMRLAKTPAPDSSEPERIQKHIDRCNSALAQMQVSKG